MPVECRTGVRMVVSSEFLFTIERTHNDTVCFSCQSFLYHINIEYRIVMRINRNSELRHLPTSGMCRKRHARERRLRPRHKTTPRQAMKKRRWGRAALAPRLAEGLDATAFGPVEILNTDGNNCLTWLGALTGSPDMTAATSCSDLLKYPFEPKYYDFLMMDFIAMDHDARRGRRGFELHMRNVVHRLDDCRHG